MTSIDAMADEIMKGLTDYADLADTVNEKGGQENCKVCEKMKYPPMLQSEQRAIC